MSTEQPNSITIHLAVPSNWGFENIVGGKHFPEGAEQNAVRLFLKDNDGERHVTVHQGDRIAFAGASWCVTTVYPLLERTRGPVATLTEIL